MLVLLNIITSSYQSWKFYILPPHNKERVLVSVVDSRLSLPGQPWHQPWQYLPCSAASNSRLRRHFAQPDFFSEILKEAAIYKNNLVAVFLFTFVPSSRGPSLWPKVHWSAHLCRSHEIMSNFNFFQRLEGHVLVGLFFWFPWPRIFCQHCDWDQQFVWDVFLPPDGSWPAKFLVGLMTSETQLIVIPKKLMIFHFQSWKITSEPWPQAPRPRPAPSYCRHQAVQPPHPWQPWAGQQ